MSNFSTSHIGHSASLAHRERWEVVVQHEVLLLLALKILQPLHVVRGSQSGRDQRLCFTAGKDRRTVGSRKYTGFNGDVANLIELGRFGTLATLSPLPADRPFAHNSVLFPRFSRGSFITLRQFRLEFLLVFRDFLIALDFRLLL